MGVDDSLDLWGCNATVGTATLVELDGPVVILRLQGRFWHERSLVLARLGHFLQTLIPVSELDFEGPADH